MAGSISLPARDAPTGIRRGTGGRFATYRHDAIVVLAIVAAEWLTYMAQVLATGAERVDASSDAIAMRFLLFDFSMTVMVVLAARWVEQQELRPRQHLLVAAAAVVVVAIAHTIVELVVPWGLAPFDYGISPSPLAYALNTLWQTMVLAALVFAYFAHRRAHFEAARRLRAVQDGQRAAARRVAEARLQSLQARVDPRLLFDLLEIVQDTYKIDPSRAERLLDELIVFLRAALSRLQGSSSTAGRECELAASYVRLLNLAGPTQAGPTTTIALADAATPFPPGVVLTIIEGLLRTEGAGSIEVSDENHPDAGYALRIRARHAPDATSLTRARSVLTNLYRDDARIDVQQHTGAFVTTVRMHHELA